MTYAQMVFAVLNIGCFLWLGLILRNVIIEVRLAGFEVRRLRHYLSNGTFYLSTNTDDLAMDSWLALRWKAHPAPDYDEDDH